MVGFFVDDYFHDSPHLPYIYLTFPQPYYKVQRPKLNVHVPHQQRRSGNPLSAFRIYILHTHSLRALALI